ncbi:MAG: DUF2442 domain-containing protein [Muribaculaceae bacterium]|nr:DUF2442 domain-containing protein [Muribaculaceae bacterium]
MEKIIKIWFKDDNLFGEDKNGKIYKQSLLWYPHLRSASESERENYEFGLDGIHWRQLDEDVSFESFCYEDAEPTVMQRFFLTHPEIDVYGFAKSLNISPVLLNNYINGVKKPDDITEIKILNHIQKLGQEMMCIVSRPSN